MFIPRKARYIAFEQARGIQGLSPALTRQIAGSGPCLGRVWAGIEPGLPKLCFPAARK